MRAVPKLVFFPCGCRAVRCDRRGSCRCCSRACVMPPELARSEYVAAFSELAARIAAVLADAPAASLPIQMTVAGGAALHFYTGERISRDVDAVFSRRIALPDDLEVAYADPDGAARLLYFD